ncbi:X-ray repair cross-complementing protein [Acrasis kona]|uniref:X-ray repair cross-complementing protein n=1 Tax=Acrasis kona TaxID=1008807 RepID=A0AAW2ZHM4_9EUKA
MVEPNNEPTSNSNQTSEAIDDDGFRTLLDVVCEQPRAPVNGSGNDIQKDQLQNGTHDKTSQSDEHVEKDTLSSSTAPKNSASNYITLQVLGRRLTFYRGPNHQTPQTNTNTSLYSFARSWYLSSLPRVQDGDSSRWNVIDLTTLTNNNTLNNTSNVITDDKDVVVTNTQHTIELEYESGTDFLTQITKKKRKRESKETLFTNMIEWCRNTKRQRRLREANQETAKKIELLCNESDTL